MGARSWPGDGPKAVLDWRCEGILKEARLTRDRELFIKKTADIERVKREGRRFQTSLFSVVSCRSNEIQGHVCIIVGKRLGNAVVRNRAKRLFRELARQFRQHLVQKRAIVVFPRRHALEVKFGKLREAWISVLTHEGVLNSASAIPCEQSASKP